jgi:hypothetical protein
MRFDSPNTDKSAFEFSHDEGIQKIDDAPSG